MGAGEVRVAVRRRRRPVELRVWRALGSVSFTLRTGRVGLGAMGLGLPVREGAVPVGFGAPAEGVMAKGLGVSEKGVRGAGAGEERDGGLLKVAVVGGWFSLAGEAS